LEKLFGGGSQKQKAQAEEKKVSPKIETRFRIVPNEIPGRVGFLAIRFNCGQCGKAVQVTVNSIIPSGANVKCHACGNITYVPPNAGKE
jgi:hypothetical protein